MLWETSIGGSHRRRARCVCAVQSILHVCRYAICPVPAQVRHVHQILQTSLLGKWNCSQTPVRVVELSGHFLCFSSKPCPTLFCSLPDLRSCSSRKHALSPLRHFLVGRPAHSLGCCLDAFQFVLN